MKAAVPAEPVGRRLSRLGRRRRRRRPRRTAHEGVQQGHDDEGGGEAQAEGGKHQDRETPERREWRKHAERQHPEHTHPEREEQRRGEDAKSTDLEARGAFGPLEPYLLNRLLAGQGSDHEGRGMCERRGGYEGP